MTNPAGNAFIDQSWRTAPIAELTAAFSVALEAQDWKAAQQALNRLQSRLYEAKGSDT